MSHRTVLLTLPALALLTGCSTVEGWFGKEQPRPQPVAMPAPPAPPAPPPTAVNMAPPGLDGRYTGTLRLARGGAASCSPATIPASATVANGQVALNLARFGSAGGMIGSDAGANVTGTDLAGQVSFAGTQLAGQMQRGTCPYTVRLTRRR